MKVLSRHRQSLLAVVLVLIGCNSGTKGDGNDAGASSSGGNSSASGGRTTAGGNSNQGGISQSGATRGGNAGVAGAAASNGSGAAPVGGAANGGAAIVGGTSNSAGAATAIGGAALGGNTGRAGTASGGANEGGSTSAAGAGTGGKVTGGIGGVATGGVATAGAATAGATTAGAAGSVTGGASGYLIEGVHGRIDVIRLSSSEAHVQANFFDGPMRMDAFDPYPPELHGVVQREGDCVLLKATLLACSPPCGANQFCGAGNLCRARPQFTAAGTVNVQGSTNGATLSPAALGYDTGTIATSNIAATATIAATGTTSSWSPSGFTISTNGVVTSGIGLPATGSEVKLTDGNNYVLTWSPSPEGTVQLLLNSGWHGSPPVATLICEAAASSGQLVVPAALVQAFPPEGGIGLLSHTSTISHLRRSRTTAHGRVLELVITGYRAVVFPIH